jgi:alkanesulfonate monooxygenase SsuD/methylene tetrahydromethanopterin reductase-like flavin-dependent oxidoreductase (luciferase family)
LIVSGNEDTVAAQLTKLLAAGLDELMVNLVPIKDAVDEFTRLMYLIGQL